MRLDLIRDTVSLYFLFFLDKPYRVTILVHNTNKKIIISDSDIEMKVTRITKYVPSFVAAS